MPISFLFWPVLLYYITSRMTNLRDGGGGPHGTVLMVAGMTIIALTILGGWHDLKIIIHYWGYSL